MELICGGLIFIVLLIFALSKASEAAKGVDDLKRTVQRLEGGLDRLRDQFADAKPASPPLGQARGGWLMRFTPPGGRLPRIRSLQPAWPRHRLAGSRLPSAPWICIFVRARQGSGCVEHRPPSACF